MKINLLELEDDLFFSLMVLPSLLNPFRCTIVAKRENSIYYAHTNRFRVVQEHIKPEVLKVQTELSKKPASMRFIT